MKLIDIDISIAGVTPLLLNKFTDEAAAKATSRTTAAITGDNGTPMEQAESKLYRHEGKIIMPQPNLFKCIMEGGRFFKAGRSKITTQKSSLIPACVSMNAAFYTLQSKEGWSVDSRPVRNPSTGGRFLCYRPVFHDWAIDFDMELDASLIDEKLLREIVDCSGKRIGLCDFRPDCKGPFGKFVVTKWDAKAA